MAPRFPHPSQGTVLWNTGPSPSGLCLRGFHPLWRAVPGHFGFTGEEATGSTTPHPPRVIPVVFGLDSSPFARRYSGNPCWFLFLPLLRCFRSGGSRSPRREHRRNRKIPTVGGPIRGSPDRRLHAPTRGLSQLVTPFIGAQAEPSARRRGMSGLLGSVFSWRSGLCIASS